MRISDWSSDVCSSDLYVYCATGSLAGSPSLRIGIASSRGERGLVGGPCMDRLQPADGRRATRVEPGAVARGFEREAHHAVGGGHGIPRKPRAPRHFGCDSHQMDVDHPLDTPLHTFDETRDKDHTK